MKTLKKISVWILIFILNFNIMPVYAQENIDLEDLDMDQIYTSQGEIGQYVIDDTPAKLEEMREILANRANKYHISEGTFRDKVSALNISSLPPVNKDEAFKKSKFFKEKGSLFRFMLEQKLAVLDELFLQGDWHAGDYSNTAVRIVGDLMMLKNKDDVLKQITFGSERNVLSDASYLISYVRQNKEFYDVIKDAKATAAECRANGYIDKECEEAYEYEQYDSSLLQKSNNRIKTITKYVSQQIDLCMSRVLVPLQSFEMGFDDPETVLSEKRDVLSLAGLCGVDSNELITLLTENTITKEDAYAKASEVVNPTKFWGKLLHKLDYITPSYYLRKYKTIDDYKSKYYDDEEYEDIDNDEAYKKALASMYLTNSLNQSIAQKVANMITYGKLFYYDNEKLGSIKDKETGKSKDVSDGFAATWHKIATHQFYKDTPAAKLAQEAILNSGRREYQDDSFTKSINEVRFIDNAKKDSEFILFAMDFIDPIMAIAPLAGSKKAATLIDKAVTTAKNTKVGKATENVLRPVEVFFTTVGDDLTEAMGKGMGVKGYGGNHFGMVDDVANAGRKVTKGTDAVTDATRVVNQADNVGDAVKGKNATSEVTALSPEELNKSLTGNVDNLVDEAKKGFSSSRNYVNPREIVDDTIRDLDIQIERLKEDRKKMGIFTSKEKKAALDEEIQRLRSERDLLYTRTSSGVLNTTSPIYDKIMQTRKVEVEKLLNSIPVNSANADARNAYVELYNKYLSVDVDALNPSQRTEFLRHFEELSGLNFSNATSRGHRGLQYRQKMLNLDNYLSSMDAGTYHIKFGGAGLGEGYMAGTESGLRQVHFGALNNTDGVSMTLKDFKKEIDKLAGPHGFQEAPLIDFTAHGYLYPAPKKGGPTWHGKFSSTGDNTISEIVDIFKNEPCNLYLRNCHAGAAMDDFIALGNKKTSNINLITEAGRNQGNRVLRRTAHNNSTSLGVAIDNISDAIERGNIGARAFINGTHYYPLETAITQARREGNIVLAKKLETYKTLLETSNVNDFNRAAQRYSQLFPKASIPSQPGFTVTTNIETVGNQVYIDDDAINYVKQVSQNMLGRFNMGGAKKAFSVPKKKTPVTLNVQSTPEIISPVETYTLDNVANNVDNIVDDFIPAI